MADEPPRSPNPFGADAPTEDRVGLAAGAVLTAVAASVAWFAVLTFMVAGKKRVEAIPADWLDIIRPRVDAGQEFKKMAAELLAINAELLVLARQQRRHPSRRSPPP